MIQRELETGESSASYINITFLLQITLLLQILSSEDNCPWAAIASLALHKLYTDWQSQGYTLPKVHYSLHVCIKTQNISKELENLPVDSSASSGGGGGGPSILDADKNALQVPSVAIILQLR